MDLNNQTQRAGDNSSQQQAQVINNNYNTVVQFDEAKCKEVCNIYFLQIQQNISTAFDIAQRRELEFENTLVNRLQKVENGMVAFSDPAFLKTLQKAQQAAICTEDKSDYDLLSELLVKRFEVNGEKKQTLYVNKAIELIDEIPEEALQGLTLFLALNSIRVTSEDIKMVRNTFANMYKKLKYTPSLPIGKGWIQDLSLLNALRILDTSTFKKCEEWIPVQYSSIMVAGIKKDSNDYHKAVSILSEYGFEENAFEENPLLSGYVYLHVGLFLDKKQLWVPSDRGHVLYDLSEKKKEMIERIKMLYDNNASLIASVKKNFVNYLKEEPILKEVFDWWENLPLAFELYPVGKMLGHVNARRLDTSFPLIQINNG